jgi:hypothetical protein
MAFWDRNHDRLVPALVGEMVLQFHPQNAGLGADDIVLIRVVARRSPVDVNSDLLFSCLFGFVCKGAAADVKEKSSEPR